MVAKAARLIREVNVEAIVPAEQEQLNRPAHLDVSARRDRTGGNCVLGNLINRHDAMRLYQRDGRVKRRVVRPSRLSMRLDDPSEAVESSGLMPALHHRLAVLEEHPYGSFLHLTLDGIAHNFLAEDSATDRAMRACLVTEDRALARLGHDFTYAVCSALAAPAPAARALRRRTSQAWI